MKKFLTIETGKNPYELQWDGSIQLIVVREDLNKDAIYYKSVYKVHYEERGHTCLRLHFYELDEQGMLNIYDTYQWNCIQSKPRYLNK